MERPASTSQWVAASIVEGAHVVVMKTVCLHATFLFLPIRACAALILALTPASLPPHTLPQTRTRKLSRVYPPPHCCLMQHGDVPDQAKTPSALHAPPGPAFHLVLCAGDGT